ncbi:MAG: zinc dependent phospholipase C family protein [Desulfohalobiaceae bacterium]|nr:zinc dependent phospholipase C family protein [Desulfohalobiaceae bacterium]
MSKTKLLFFLAALLGGLALPDQALAWGPGVHLYLGNYFLAHLHLFSASTAQLLQENGFAFLYGSLSADMLVGKGRELTPNHCHSWDAGLRLLQKVEAPDLRAYALGYLGHLASDVVAHNYYVPNMLQLNRRRGRVGHVSVELRADRQVDYSNKQLRRIIQTTWRDADELLLRTLRQSRMSFSLKKMVYKSGLSLSRCDPLERKRLVRGLKEQSEENDYLRDMLELSRQVITDCLNRTGDSSVAQFDPMGFENLGLVKKNRTKTSFEPSKREVALFFVPAMCLLSL